MVTTTQHQDQERRRYPGADLTHRDDCPAPLVLTTRIHHWRTRAIGRCVNCERVGLVDVSRETSDVL